MLSGPVITWRNRFTGIVAKNSRHQNRVQPPSREVHRLRAAHVDTAQQGDIDQPADNRPVRYRRLHLRVMHAQCFYCKSGET